MEELTRAPYKETMVLACMMRMHDVHQRRDVHQSGHQE